jgi:hypothetical protein
VARVDELDVDSALHSYTLLRYSRTLGRLAGLEGYACDTVCSSAAVLATAATSSIAAPSSGFLSSSSSKHRLARVTNRGPLPEVAPISIRERPLLRWLQVDGEFPRRAVVQAPFHVSHDL